jgi:hypothetical protein
MSNKLVNINFIGGEFNGEVLKNYAINPLPPQFYFREEAYFASEDSGGMSIRKGRLNKNWHSYLASMYVRKHIENKTAENAVYEFSEKVMIDRCSFLTSKKALCKEPAIYGETYCSKHKQET